MGQWMSDRADDLEGFLFPQREFSILIWGQSQAGKTTCSKLFKKFYKKIKVENSSQETVDKKISVQGVVNDEIYLEVYDFQEKEQWRTMCSFDSLIFVLDSTLEDVGEVKKDFELLAKMENFQQKKGKEIPFLILLNKKDLETSKISKENIVQMFGLDNLNLKWNVEEVSMEKDEESVKKAIQWMCDILYPPLPGWLARFAFFELESGIEDLPNVVDSDDEEVVSVEVKTDEFIKN
jgi:signal recognition particle receptor subunit beta